MKKRLLLIAALALAIGIGVAGASSPPTQAEPPYTDQAMGPWVTARLNYAAVPASTPIAQGSAIAAARKFTQAPVTATVQSIKLASFNDPFRGPRLVWVVDLDGLDLVAPVGLHDGSPGPRITRSVLLVSATEPDHVVAQYSLSPAQ